MKKLVLLAVALVFCVLFCGCTDFDADFGIDENCNAYMKYHIELDMQEYDAQYVSSIKEALTYFCDYYQNVLGFTVEKDEKTDRKSASADLSYIVECETYAEAFEELKKMLTDPTRTPFLTVQMAADAAEYEEGYIFSAETDFGKILATSGYEAFPKDLNEMICEGIDSAEGSFTITLPATTVVDSVGKTELAGCFCTETVDFSAKEPITLKLITRLSRDGGLHAVMSTEEAIRNLNSQKKLYVGIAAALGVLALAALAMSIVLAKKHKAAAQAHLGEEAVACVPADSALTASEAPENVSVEAAEDEAPVE